MRKKSFSYVLIILFLFILAVSAYLFSQNRHFDALALWGVSMVVMWFMLRIIEKAQNRTDYLGEPDEEEDKK